MKFSHRRQFMHLAAGAAVLPAVSHLARAQAYPARPVHVMVGYPPGTSPDVAARLIGQWLSERLGQQFVIENKVGASGNLAAEAVVRASPNGYMLLALGAPDAINVTFQEKLNFNLLRDIAPVAGLIRLPNVIVVHPKPFRSSPLMPRRTLAK
jgi:tripartite-type tricarboxylate transporter receptor subunit TctC